MGIFKKLFAKGAEGTKQARPERQQPQTQEQQPDEGMIIVQDAYGREMRIPRSEWTQKVLPATIEKQWDNPDELYGVIVAAVRDGFAAEVADAAKHLHETDPDHTRSTALYCVILRQQGHLDDAEAVAREFLTQRGEDSLILTNLAIVQQAKGNVDDAEKTFWRALELDPNFQDSFGQYWKIFDNRGGKPASDEASKRVAALPGSWRAQLWLARGAIAAGDFQEAERLHREAIANAGNPSPTDLLMQISGDLGNAGRIPQILQLVEPRFNPEVHGLTVGNNLIKAHVEQGQYEEAHKILDELFAQQRPDWNQTLGYWDTEIAKGRVAATPVEDKWDVRMLEFEGPIWLPESSRTKDVFLKGPREDPTICFLGSTISEQGPREKLAIADDVGRFSRFLPMFLAEQVFFNSKVRTTILQPYIVGRNSGFCLLGEPTSDEDAAKYGRQASNPAKYIVTTHLTIGEPNWQVEMRLVRTEDGECLGSSQAGFSVRDPEAEISRITHDLLQMLSERAGLNTFASHSPYEPPAGEYFLDYALRLEQMLVLRCGGGGLHGEREILNGNIQLCLALPRNVTVRVLMAQTFLEMKRLKPQVPSEFKERVTNLQNDFPLFAVAQIAVEEILSEAFAVNG